jgi:NTE family protein
VIPKQRRVGVCFSGGAARGISHLGVLKALREMHIPVEVLSGTSSGAIVSSFYGAGYLPEEILRILQQTNVGRLMRPAFSRFGLMNLDEVEKVLLKYLGDISFENLKYEVVITATDIDQGTVVYFSEGKLLKPLLASCSVPILYKPVSYQNRLLLDGGLLNNMPVECLTDRCDFVVGVHCNPLNHHARVTSFKSMIERTFHLAINNNVQARYKYCDLLIEAPALKDFGLLSYNKANELFETGYYYTLSLADKLKPLAAY